MRWKSYHFVELQSELQAGTIKNSLALVDTGYVAGYELNSDYIENENSTLRYAGTTTTQAGNLIALIRDANEVASGVVVAVDQESRTITFNSLLTLFDTEVLNLYRQDLEQYYIAYEPVQEIAKQIGTAFNALDTDKYRRVPLSIVTSGQANRVEWDIESNAFNLRDFIVQQFHSQNVVVQASLVFESTLAYIRIRIFVNTNQQGILKMNVGSMSITHQESTEPQSTVCHILAKPYSITWTVKGRDENGNSVNIPMEDRRDTDKRILSTHYLTIDGRVVEDSTDPLRFEQYKLAVVEYEQMINSGERDPANSEEANDPNKQNTGKPIYKPNDELTQSQAAQNELGNNEYNHFVTIETHKDNALFNDLLIGDAVTIVHKVFGDVQESELSIDTSNPSYIPLPSMVDSEQERQAYRLDSIYTGRKESSDSDIITLTFGKIRVHYNEIINQLLKQR